MDVMQTAIMKIIYVIIMLYRFMSAVSAMLVIMLVVGLTTHSLNYSMQGIKASLTYLSTNNFFVNDELFANLRRQCSDWLPKPKEQIMNLANEDCGFGYHFHFSRLEWFCSEPCSTALKTVFILASSC